MVSKQAGNTKETPSNCSLKKCSWNSVPPAENSQECVGCEGLLAGMAYRDWKWVKADAR